jgi:catechol 2,3-dioxygenase-like lactoylglutathione lyase family enzyme
MTHAAPTYTGGGDPAGRFSDYDPAWLDNLADDVTVEGSLLDGAAQGAEAVRAIVGTIRTLYERQEFNFAGSWGDDRFIEDYTAQVRGEPIGCVALVTLNDAGQTQHIAANYRPLSSLLLLSRLLGEKFADTPYAEYFLASEAPNGQQSTLGGNMTSTGASTESFSEVPDVGTIDMKLEVVTLPVSDVDRAKHFYQSLGWRMDADIVVGDAFRVVQVTPPRSASSISFGKGLTTAEPGSAQRLILAVGDIDAAREDLVRRGVDVSGVFHLDGGPVPGPDPQGRSYQTLASFSDPDGNGWLLQEIKTRLPGREWED